MSRSVFGEMQLTHISSNFQSSYCNLRSRVTGAKPYLAFLLFWFWKKLWHFYINSPCILLNQNINFNKNKKESKMENLTHIFREKNLVLQLIKESQIKCKTVVSWNLRKKEEWTFCTVCFVWRNIFNIFVLSQCIVYWTHFQKIHTFTYQKTLPHTFFLLVFKIDKNL